MLTRTNVSYYCNAFVRVVDASELIGQPPTSGEYVNTIMLRIVTLQTRMHSCDLKKCYNIILYVQIIICIKVFVRTTTVVIGFFAIFDRDRTVLGNVDRKYRVNCPALL